MNDSGIALLVGIPPHWEVRRLKELGKLIGGAGFPHEFQGASDLELPFFKVMDLGLVSQNQLMMEADNSTDRQTARILGASIVVAGDIVFAKVGAALLLGRFRQIGRDCCIDNNMIAFRPGSLVQPGFALHALSRIRFADIVNPGAVPSINGNQIGELSIAIPPLEIQRRIASYLDEKTARIDALIEKKRSLLDRLADKRQAIITQAVTKGLNPAAPMKDSGIDWLGQIPAHWDIVPLKWQCTIRSGQVDPAEPPFDEMILVAPDHIESSTGRLLGAQTASEQAAISGKYLCKPTDVLYSKIRPALRKVALTNRTCLCSADMYAINPGNDFERDYLFYFLLTDAFTAYAELTSMRVAMPKVNRDAIGSFPLPKPPVAEQRTISAWILTKLDALDGVIESVRGSVTQIIEYRSALITAAVTGQIEGLR